MKVVEQLTGAVNGANATFLTSQAFTPGTLLPLINGQVQDLACFSEAPPQTVTLTLPPKSGDVVTARYEAA